jgi:hypothetical protein
MRSLSGCYDHISTDAPDWRISRFEIPEMRVLYGLESNSRTAMYRLRSGGQAIYDCVGIVVEPCLCPAQR